MRLRRRAIDITFDADGEVTNLEGVQGQTLPAEIRDCVLALLQGHCSPSLAGTTKTFMTCHSWIA